MADKPTPRASPLSSADNIAPGELLMADMRRRTQQLQADLAPIMFDAQNIIEEDAFVHYFLPMFAGELGQDRVKINEILQSWYRVAGNPFTAVDVVKNGQRVATVPAIRTNILTGKPTDQVKDIGTVFDDAAHHATLSPRGAQAMIVTALHQRYMVNIPRPDLSVEQRAWFDLLNHYGKAPASLSLQKAVAGGKAPPPEDDFEYE
jgi:hypothetical protein